MSKKRVRKVDNANAQTDKIHTEQQERIQKHKPTETFSKTDTSGYTKCGEGERKEKNTTTTTKNNKRVKGKIAFKRKPRRSGQNQNSSHDLKRRWEDPTENQSLHLTGLFL
ncbi:hypothetical protein CEXT_690481 [Caerostris extrusa]|uniref:Uncharacterized protein n=1 Tax=Caerostris extrusa TaxID=172846 RepID=A0AAV4MLK0_CAEEX|nr:hypothetical protein CEXT_690481 [Caerostris extrusa]